MKKRNWLAKELRETKVFHEKKASKTYRKRKRQLEEEEEQLELDLDKDEWVPEDYWCEER